MDFVFSEKILTGILNSQNNPHAYSGYLETAHLYFLWSTSSEFWWRLNCTESGRAVLPKIYDSTTAYQQIDFLKNQKQFAFIDSAMMNSYESLLKLLDGVRFTRNGIAHSERLRLSEVPLAECSENMSQQLEGIQKEVKKGLEFPPLHPRWEALVKVGTRNGKHLCYVYTEQERFGRKIWCWTPEVLDADTREFKRGDMRSQSKLKEQRLYYYRRPRSFGESYEMSCAYPFVQIQVPDHEPYAPSSVWLFSKVSAYQIGLCKGVDILCSDNTKEADTRYIPEAIPQGEVCGNGFLTVVSRENSAGYGDRDKRVLRNKYHRNYSTWLRTDAADAAIKKTMEHLKQEIFVPVVYLYGPGGIGKTAAVQNLLDTYAGRNFYQYLIFLSAKKQEWDQLQGISNVKYRNSHQSFSDFASLKTALHNIFSSDSDSEVTDSALYEGKSILLVLDDFESVDELEQRRILDYLNKNFVHCEKQQFQQKKRQVIITCRAHPGEGHAGNVHMQPLDENGTAAFARFCARQMKEARERWYDEELGTSDDPQCQTLGQAARRKLLQNLTQGTPLTIQAIVSFYRKADFQESAKNHTALEDYLRKDTYRYLNTSELKKAAALCVYLTDSVGECTIERLQAMWDYDDQGDVSKYVKTLCDYVVLQKDAESTAFSFQNNMREYIKNGFLRDEKRDGVLQQDRIRLACWLSEYQQDSVCECLLRQLRRQVQLWYRLHDMENHWKKLHGCADWLPASDTNEDVNSVQYNMISLYTAIGRIGKPAPWQSRVVYQLLNQVYYDFKEKSQNLYKSVLNLDELKELYRVDLLRSSTHSFPAKAWSLKDRISQTLMTCCREADTYDEKNGLLFIWSAMLLVQEMYHKDMKPPEEFARWLNSATITFTPTLGTIGINDCQIFICQLEEVVSLLSGDPGADGNATKALEERCKTFRYVFSNVPTNPDDHLFFGGNS